MKDAILSRHRHSISVTWNKMNDYAWCNDEIRRCSRPSLQNRNSETWSDVWYASPKAPSSRERRIQVPNTRYMVHDQSHHEVKRDTPHATTHNDIRCYRLRRRGARHAARLLLSLPSSRLGAPLSLAKQTIKRVQSWGGNHMYICLLKTVLWRCTCLV